MQKTLVRPAAGADFPVLLAIDQQCFEPGIAYDRAELSYFMKRRGARTLVIEAGGRIAGFLLMEISRRRRSATIVTLDIREEYRSRGFGSRLLHASEQILRAENIESYDLQVDVKNRRAIAFYERHKFEIAATLPDYYEDGRDAYEMRKTIS